MVTDPESNSKAVWHQEGSGNVTEVIVVHVVVLEDPSVVMREAFGFTYIVVAIPNTSSGPSFVHTPGRNCVAMGDIGVGAKTIQPSLTTILFMFIKVDYQT